MTDRLRRGIPLVPALVLALLGGACSKDPEVAARDYMASGDRYAEQGRHSEAIIEYGNAVKARPNWAEAHYKRARAYMESGDPVKAYGSYSRAADLDPSNLDAQLQAGMLLLAAGEFQAARTRAEVALQAHPDNPQALILLGNAMAGLNETSRAARQIEEAIRLDPSFAPAWTALGAVQFVGGGRERAGDAFRKAVSLAPSSVDARLALANYHWAMDELPDAERVLREALGLDARHAGVHRSLALLYLTSGRAPQAEPHFQALAERDPRGRLGLADYYAGTGRPDRALPILQDLERGEDKGRAREARLRIAAIEYGDGNRDEAHRIVDALIEERPRYAEARVAKARMILAENGDADAAALHAREAVSADSSSLEAQYTLGLAAVARNDIAEAERAFGRVVQLNPRARAAQLQLAALRLARGEAAGAQRAAEEAARLQPDDAEAAVLLARSLRAQGDFPRAQRELATRIARQPESAPLHVEMGWVALGRREPARARASFEEALRLAPYYHEARAGVISVEIAERSTKRARERLDGWMAGSPDDLRLRLLSARLHMLDNDAAAAEGELRRIITIEPSLLDAYDLLGQLFMAQGQLDRALAEYEALAARARAPEGALTMAGLIHEARGDRPGGKAKYEQALRANPRAGVAANNLAWIYAEEGRLDDALRLATVATEELRQRPEAEDTLGWVYYRKGLPGHAIPAFERAIARAPENPVYHYHLGRAHLKAGREQQGQAALRRALELKTDFNGADEARRLLAEKAEGSKQ